MKDEAENRWEEAIGKRRLPAVQRFNSRKATGNSARIKDEGLKDKTKPLRPTAGDLAAFDTCKNQHGAAGSPAKPPTRKGFHSCRLSV